MTPTVGTIMLTTNASKTPSPEPDNHFSRIMTTTKRDLVVELSNRTGMTQSQAFDLLQQALDLIAEELAQGHEVALRRFGTFELRVTKSKIGRNPNKPGSEMTIPRRAVVRFKPGKELKIQVASVLSKLLDGAEEEPGADS